MTRQNRNSQVHHTGSHQEPQPSERAHYHSVTGHGNSQSKHYEQIAQNVAFSFQYDFAAQHYPQQIEPDAYNSVASNRQYHIQPETEYYQIPRTWTSAKPELGRVTNHPASDYGHHHSNGYNYSHDVLPAQTQTTYSDTSTSIYGGNRRQTQPNLQAVDSNPPSMNGMARWKSQDQSKGPWDGIGYVAQNSDYAVRRK